MLEEKILSYLKEMSQEHLAEGLHGLSELEQIIFLKQLEKYGLQKRVETKSDHAFQAEPLDDFPKAGNKESIEDGIALLSQGKMGCLILAGGQGTRFGQDVPKGTFPVSVIKQKSLFQLFAEKTCAASYRAGRDLPLAVMTSPLNQEATSVFFEQNARFGLKENQLDLFSQEMLPFLDEKGNYVLQRPGFLAEGPDGNGNTLIAFYKEGIFEKWRRMGVEYVNVILVDNPLADPFDAELLSFTAKSGHEIALKAVLRKNEEEKVGVIGKSQGKLKVIEYSELSSEEGKARNEKGELRWALANLSLFCFRMDFIERIVQEKKELPWHFAKKEANLYARGMFYKAFIQKRETFIFDWLNFTDRAGALVYERERCFAPLKNKTGDASIETVRAALLESDRRIYQEISGLLPPKREFELSQDFYYPSLQLLQKWKNRPLPDIDYIES